MNTQYYKGFSIEVYSACACADCFIASINGTFFSSLTYSNSEDNCLALAVNAIDNNLLTF